MGLMAAMVVGATVNCWAAAAVRYELPVELLYAIAQQESSHNPRAIGRNKNGSRDLGIMQINSTWLSTLQQYGITERVLLDEPCTNIQVGAWILAQEVRRSGYTWQAIGAYNAGPITAKTTPAVRARKLEIYRSYSNKVLGHWHKLRARRAKAKAPVAKVVADATR